VATDYLVREFDYGGYHCSLELPHRRAGDPIVSLGNGLLGVTVPRADASDDVLTADWRARSPAHRRRAPADRPPITVICAR
jgi:hypothetical protein